ncbi:Flagellar basal-body P-ring formation protein FlgA [hydrothermal vent metagenome]|uniref:Flagellar basal-body P-ring formation protein FlgA n=1 Tax=hydrothermal vent metagenome TaxID=652676 RepID=A0A1W1C6I8_9ZZZZ
MKVLLFLLLCLISLDAEYLKKEYFTPSNDINLSLITNDPKNDKTIAHIDRNRYLKRIRTKDLLQILQKNGYRHFKAKTSYVTFLKRSNLDLSRLKKKLEDAYKDSYRRIDIHSIEIIPKGHIQTLPKDFGFKIRSGELLHSHGTLSILTPKKRQIFFEYFLDATLPVYKSTKRIEKGEILSLKNLQKQMIHFDRFRALPVQKLDALQAKHHITKAKLITVRDVERLDLVRRGEFVSVVLKKSNLEIDMSAKSLQDGTLNDIILIQNSRGKKLRARVVGKNIVEIEAPR